MDINKLRNDEITLQESEEKHRILFRDSPDAYLVIVDGIFVDCNRATERMLRGDKSQIIGKPPELISPEFQPDGRTSAEAARQKIKEALSSGNNTFEWLHRRLDGTDFWVEVSIAAIDLDGKKALFTIWRDITGRKQTETALKRSEYFLQSTLDGLSAHIALLDENGTILLVNRAWREFAIQNGMPADVVSEGSNYLYACTDATGSNSEEASLFADGIRHVLAGDTEKFQMEYPCHSENDKRWFICRVTPFPGDGSRRVVVAHENITDRKLTEETLEESRRKLETLSITDGLTGIANRRHFDTVLETEYGRHIRSGGPLSLIMLDIDHFKAFNDTYGHIKGDECLRQVGRILAEYTTRAADVAARYGGEEFACILPETELHGAIIIAEQIRRGILALAIPHINSGVNTHVTASLGVVSVECTLDGSALDILSQADKLLYKAKSSGRNRVEIVTLAVSPESDKTVRGNFVQLVWKDYFCSGNQLIDAQHKSLLNTSNKLLEAILSSRPAFEISTLIAELLSEAASHFSDEQSILEEAGFQGLKRHIEEHSRLLALGTELSDQFKDSTLSIGDVFRFLAYDVVMLHMLGADREYFPLIRN